MYQINGINGLNPYYTGILYTSLCVNDGIRSKFAVLILIILEYYIRVEYAMKVSCIAKGLNPYYTGILYTSQTESTSVIRKYVLILIILEYYIRGKYTALFSTTKRCLNPYYTGILYTSNQLIIG